MSNVSNVSNMIQLISAREPVWGDKNHTCINITCKFSHLADEILFSANQHDCEEHGRDAYRRALAGEFGPIAPYVPHMPNYTREQLEANIRASRDARLSYSDWTISSDLPESFREPWKVYRQALRDVPLQHDFPYYVVWPVPPGPGAGGPMGPYPYPPKTINGKYDPDTDE